MLLCVSGFLLCSSAVIILRSVLSYIRSLNLCFFLTRCSTEQVLKPLNVCFQPQLIFNRIIFSTVLILKWTLMWNGLIQNILIDSELSKSDNNNQVSFKFVHYKSFSEAHIFCLTLSKINHGLYTPQSRKSVHSWNFLHQYQIHVLQIFANLRRFFSPQI